MFEPKHDTVVEISQQVSPTEKKLISSLPLKKGQKVWELNFKTGKIQLAEVKWDLLFSGAKKGEVIIKDLHIYDVAINLKNANKKFQKKCKQMVDNYVNQKKNGYKESEIQG
jgi:hypothetical protein